MRMAVPFEIIYKRLSDLCAFDGTHLVYVSDLPNSLSKASLAAPYEIARRER